MNLFEKLFTVSDSAYLLDCFLNENMQIVNEFYNSEYSSVLDSRDSIERFILLKSNVVEQLDYKKSYNRAFVSILLDFCERFNFIAAAPRILSVLEENKINIGHRLQAVRLYLYNIDCNSRLVERFDLICEKIQTSVEIEEDNDKRALATFLNYYSIVIRDTRIQFAEQVKQKIINSIKNESFHFLKSRYIVDALSVELGYPETAFEKIQSIIDYLLDKKGILSPVFYEEGDVLLIEDDTEYSKILNNTGRNFKSIRKISVNKIIGIPDKKQIYNSLGRGVAILENESQMYFYMYSFGSAHHAKMISALDKISFEEIENDIEIFDWSCGQGLASIVFYEYMQTKSISLSIKTTTLIEPSNICLKRAALHVKHFNETCSIRTTCKDIDSLEKNDVKSIENNTKIHFFSNILDVDDFSIVNLIDLIENTQKGLNYFVIVSPYITDTKTDRVDSFVRHFSHYDTFKLLRDKTNGGRLDDEYWNCNNNYNGNLGVFCTHTACGCENKWTRVIRVFKVEF